MAFYKFGNIRVVLAEPSTGLRVELKESLLGIGFGDILDTGNMSQVVSSIKDDAVDLLIGDTKLPEGDLGEVIYQMRHGDLGRNPFIVVVTLVSNPTPEKIRGVINTGTDVVLVKPFDKEDLCERVLALAEGRKRFVVTTDYIGPDRRLKPRPGTMEIPRISVPNPLRMRVTGQVDTLRTRRAIDVAAMILNKQKVERHALQITFLVERIRVGSINNVLSDSARIDMGRLGLVASDMSRRVTKTPYAHTTEMCLTMVQTARQMFQSPETYDSDNFIMLNKLAQAIYNPIKRQSDMEAKEVADQEARAFSD